MRPPRLDEEGNVIPFTDFDHYGKIMHLVPDALLDTRAGKITAWHDERPQPTYDEIDAVSYEDAELAMLPPTAALMADADIILQAILDVSPGLRSKVEAHLIGKRGK
jgi:hypothetical protein